MIRQHIMERAQSLNSGRIELNNREMQLGDRLSLLENNLTQEGIADRSVGRSVQRRNHRHLGRIPGDCSAPAGWQLREAALELLDELGVARARLRLRR